jgi:magnesium transporter
MDLLEDVEIELRQAQETTFTATYNKLWMLTSVISNNMNTIMKQMTSISNINDSTVIASFTE